jgi:hypothetical protein
LSIHPIRAYSGIQDFKLNMTFKSSVLPRSLKDYEIDPKTGFLPPEEPLRRLPHDSIFDPWERLIDDFQGLLLSGQLRKRVQEVSIYLILNNKMIRRVT